MATDAARNYRLESVLRLVINVLEDGQKGMAEMGEHLKDEHLRGFFFAESLKRAGFRGELENELHRHGVSDVCETGTAAAAVYRAWADLKTNLGGSDHTLLETAEQGEDMAVGAYRDALDQELPLPIRQMLTQQQAQIVLSREYVREQRDTLHGLHGK